MTLEQRTELIGSHANAGEDGTQGPFGHVSARMDRDCNSASVGMAHEAVATLDPHNSESGAFERLDDLRSWYCRDTARHKPANYQRSGNVECQRHLVWYPNLFDEKFQAGP